jgi:Na+-driven multidrug efflux pump
MRIDGFVMMPAFSFGAAMTTFAGQNIGAGRIDRVETGAKKGTLVAMATSAVITSLIVLFGKYLMMLFTDTQELIDQSYHMMLIMGAGYIVMEVTQCLQGIMRGAGDTLAPMWLSMITTVAIRVPLAYLMTWMTRSPENPHGLFSMMFVSMLISWILGAIMTLIVYRSGRWKQKAII